MSLAAHQWQQFPSARYITVGECSVYHSLHRLVCIFPTHHCGFPLPDGVEDGVGGVKDVGQHGSQLRTRYALVFIQVEDSEEKHTAIVEGAMEDHCQPLS